MMSPVVSQAGIEAFQDRILAFYRREGRMFTWRATSDPYNILVSEFMLQQTQTERVVRKYPPFIAAFPTLGNLAAAPLQEILRIWHGLGYNRRALALQASARIIWEEHDGHVPHTAEELTALPGIGPATAGAVLAFAYQIPTAFIETNIRRVFIHAFFPGRTAVKDVEILPLVEASLDRDNPRAWYYALMDYGVMLKQTTLNPNRSSAHYQRQAPFEGSHRQLRGRILAALVQHGPSTPRQLARMLRRNPSEIRKTLHVLEMEGFLQHRDDIFHIP